MPESIEKLISKTSSNKDIFDESIKPYKDAFKESGFSETLNYIAPKANKEQKNRILKIIWFNPPFFRSVKSNIGRIFLRLISKHFPRNHTMQKIFNRNTFKIKYSCLRNISFIISSHNRNILSPKQQSFGCDCRGKNEWQFNGECQTPSVIYREDVDNDSNDEKNIYFRITDNAFKERCRNHIRDLKHVKYEYSAELVKYIRQLKREKISFSVKWKIITKMYGSPNPLLCKLCLTEKLWIINFINDRNMLNKRSELVINI